MELEGVLYGELGLHVRRAFGAGRRDDIGDMVGLPDTVIQVANWSDVIRAVREKPLQAEQQRARAGVTFACAYVRLRGGVWRAVMTPQQWTTMWREATTVPY